MIHRSDDDEALCPARVLLEQARSIPKKRRRCARVCIVCTTDDGHGGRARQIARRFCGTEMPNCGYMYALKRTYSTLRQTKRVPALFFSTVTVSLETRRSSTVCFYTHAQTQTHSHTHCTTCSPILLLGSYPVFTPLPYSVVMDIALVLTCISLDNTESQAVFHALSELQT